MLWSSVFIAAQVLLIAQGVAAYANSMLTVNQMMDRGVLVGIPFIAHGGMWGDAFIVAPLVATIVARHGHQWPAGYWALALAGGFAASWLMHMTYVQAPYPEAHVEAGKLTAAGWLHMAYMGLAFAILILFYIATPDPSPFLMWLASMLLIIHVILGTHIPMKIVAPGWFPPYPILDLPTAGVVGGVAVLLTAVTWWRVGW